MCSGSCARPATVRPYEHGKGWSRRTSARAGKPAAGAARSSERTVRRCDVAVTLAHLNALAAAVMPAPLALTRPRECGRLWQVECGNQSMSSQPDFLEFDLEAELAFESNVTGDAAHVHSSPMQLAGDGDRTGATISIPTLAEVAATRQRRADGAGAAAMEMFMRSGTHGLVQRQGVVHAATDVGAPEQTTAVDQSPSSRPRPFDAIPRMQQTTLPLATRALTFMAPLANQQWQSMAIDSSYVPKIGTLFKEQTFGPEPYSTILALSPPCARGKSTAFHGYMDELFERKPSSRVLLLSANILYGTSLAAELHRKYATSAGSINVGFYREEMDLDQFNVVVCSLESLHHLERQRFDAILIDEIRTIARLVGGATMRDFNNVYLLRELGAKAADVVVCDADLLFKIDESEPNTLVYDFMRLVFPARPVLHASLSHPGPDHLQRSVDLLFDYKQGKRNPGRSTFFKELEAAARAWHGDHAKRFALVVGSKPQLEEIYTFLVGQMKVPVKPYSGDTNERSKYEDLKNPDWAWLEFGCIASTTSLSIGVDPKEIEFDRVFMWTHPMGCTLLTQFQAAMRYGRQAAYPLGNQVICMLVKCVPPGVRELAIQQGKRKPTVPPTYEGEFTTVNQRRAAAARHAAKEIAAVGGRLVGTTPIHAVADQLLRVMAHGALERRFQAFDHYTAVKRCIEHYGWTIDPESLARAHEVPSTFDFEALSGVLEDDDDRFGAGSSQIEKWKWVVGEVLRRGEAGLFDDYCYGLAAGEQLKQQHKSSKEQYLVKAYWLLQHVRRLPTGDAESAAEQLEAMDRPGVLDGLHLNAHMRCMDPATVQRADNARRHEEGSSTPHPLLKPAVGMRMDAAERLAKLLDVERPYADCDLPQWVVDIARRETFKQSTYNDRTLLKCLQMLVMELGAKQQPTCGPTGGILGQLKTAAIAIGMELDAPMERIHHPNATAKCGKIRVAKSLQFKQILPDMIDDWQLYSKRLGFKVCTAGWHDLHELVYDEEAVLSMSDDAELDPSLFAPLHEMLDQRTEKIDGAALQTELTRLSSLQDHTARDKRWLDWLNAADVAASKPCDDGMRSLTVTYSKSFSRAIGRRTASHPSLQHCPSGLRPLLVMYLYHDIDMVNCHPTLMLQVAENMGVPAAA